MEARGDRARSLPHKSGPAFYQVDRYPANDIKEVSSSGMTAELHSGLTAFLNDDSAVEVIGCTIE
jgi:hypothetical protein